VWNPDLPSAEPFRQHWLPVPDNDDLDNGLKLQWVEFLRDVVAGRPHRFDLLSAPWRAACRAGAALLGRGSPYFRPGDQPVSPVLHVPGGGSHELASAQELIRRSAAVGAEVGGRIAAGAGTDQLDLATVAGGQSGLPPFL
jgi:hypothetical protein